MDNGFNMHLQLSLQKESVMRVCWCIQCKRSVAYYKNGRVEYDYPLAATQQKISHITCLRCLKKPFPEISFWKPQGLQSFILAIKEVMIVN